MTESNATILLEEHADGVMHLILNRPDMHNAFDDHLIIKVTQALEKISQNPSARAIVLRSNGKNFSAGADLNWMRRIAALNFAENVADARQLATLMQTLNECPLPTLCLVQGAAFGGALGLISCCDIAIATESANFCLSETRIGLVPAVISPYVIRAIGERQARRYFLTAEKFDAHTALQLGLVHKIVAEEKMLEEAEQFCNILLNNSPNAILKAKRLIRDVAGHPIDDETIGYTTELIAFMRVSEQGQEGLSAFLEKRPAAWQRGDKS
ncbi:MAG TPA: enoyl-CoA hydratase/isomerase family protein [Pseudomonadales bacterium]|nr:enoyl-CoA hydratase/isomerase family protein [Pseudomonadales bacterium]